MIAPERGTTGLRRTLSWHGSAGLWAVLGLLFLSATGLTWSKYAGANVDQLRTTLGWSTPAISTAFPNHAEHSGAGTASIDGVGVDQVAQRAGSAGLSGPLEIVWPGEPGTAYVVKEVDNQWPQRLDQVAIDPGTGQVTDRLRFAGFPLAAKLTRWGIDAHMGLLFGLANQIVLAALALGLIAIS
jgi:uncharacterized iron-regulated membrane protein